MQSDIITFLFLSQILSITTTMQCQQRYSGNLLQFYQIEICNFEEKSLNVYVTFSCENINGIKICKTYRDGKHKGISSLLFPLDYVYSLILCHYGIMFSLKCTLSLSFAFLPVMFNYNIYKNESNLHLTFICILHSIMYTIFECYFL